MNVPWVHTYSDLESIGVRVSEQQRLATEGGRQVLTLQRLPALEVCGCGAEHFEAVPDADGGPYLIPVVIDTYSPDELTKPLWHEATLLGEELEARWGEWWRYFPSYLGMTRSTAIDEWYEADVPLPFRVFTGVPLLTDADTALAGEVIDGFRKIIYETDYDALREFCHYEEGFMQGWSDFDPDDADDEEAQKYRDLFDEMARRGRIMRYGSHGEWKFGLPLVFQPVEEVLGADALSLWRRVHRGSRQATLAIEGATAPQRLDQLTYMEREWNPWF